jgi:Xaa-Pro dipeptidase
MLYFEKSEYRERVRNVKEAMYHQAVEVLLVSDPANMNYLTGYDGWSFYVHQGVIVVIDQDAPIWFGRQQDSNGARLTSWLPPENIYGYADDYVQSNLKHPMEFVAQLLTASNWEKRNLGVEMDNYYFTAMCLEQLRAHLPQARISNANRLVNWVRAVKSEQEIVYMKMAARIVEKVMQTAVDAVAPGVREADGCAKPMPPPRSYMPRSAAPMILAATTAPSCPSCPRAFELPPRIFPGPTAPMRAARSCFWSCPAASTAITRRCRARS